MKSLIKCQHWPCICSLWSEEKEGREGGLLEKASLVAPQQ